MLLDTPPVLFAYCILHTAYCCCCCSLSTAGAHLASLVNDNTHNKVFFCWNIPADAQTSTDSSSSSQYAPAASMASTHFIHCMAATSVAVDNKAVENISAVASASAGCACLATEAGRPSAPQEPSSCPSAYAPFLPAFEPELASFGFSNNATFLCSDEAFLSPQSGAYPDFASLG